jgi:hypothetical protein
MPPASVLNSILLPVAFWGALIALLKAAPLAKCQQIAYSPLEPTTLELSGFCSFSHLRNGPASYPSKAHLQAH